MPLPSAPGAPIFLIGFMGSGKTTVGRLLAERLGWSFADLDDVIVRSAGLTVAEIFAGEGEAGFRRRETAAVRGGGRAARSWSRPAAARPAARRTWR